MPITLNVGTGGATLATEQISSEEYQEIKVVLGATPTQLSSNTGNADAGTARVVLASDQPSVTVDNAGLTELAAAINASRVDVNIAASGATVTVDGSGVTQPVSIANIDNLNSSDFDTGAGTDTTPSIGIAVAANGGAVVITGDVANGLDVDVTRVSGTVTVDGSGVTQPVSGTVTANLGATDNAVIDQIEVNTSYGDSVGPGTEAAALRVTLANDSTGLLSVDDNGGSLTVDWNGTAPPIGAGVEATALRVTVATDSTGVLTVDNDGTFAVQVNGDALTALQVIDNPVFVDDAAFTLATSSVMVAGAIRDDSLTTLTAVEGDAVPLRVSSTGALHVTGAGGGTQYNVDDAAGGTDTGTVALAVRDDALTTLTPIDGDYVPLRVSSTGALHVTGGGGGTEYTEDVATPDPIVGTATLMERDDALATLTPVEGDWVGLRSNARGALWVELDTTNDVTIADGGNVISVDWSGTAPPIGAGTEATALRVTVATDSTGVLTVDGAVTADLGANNDVQGAVANDAAAASNPFLVGLRANVAAPTAISTAGDAVYGWGDNFGRQITWDCHPNPTAPTYLNKTTTAIQDVVAAPGADTHIHVTGFTLSNAAAATNLVTLSDGATTRYVFELAADGGGVAKTFKVPWRLAVNSALRATCGTAGDVHITAETFNMADQ